MPCRGNAMEAELTAKATAPASVGPALPAELVHFTRIQGWEFRIWRFASLLSVEYW